MEQDNDGGISVTIDGFISNYKTGYLQEVLDIGRRLRSIGNVTGCTVNFFKVDEGLHANDRVCALYDIPAKCLRLYCIRLTDKIVIVGSGGPKATRTWQEDPVLRREVHAMMHVSEIVRAKLINGDIRISGIGLRLEGDLFISRI
jgi:hypothetical protein